MTKILQKLPQATKGECGQRGEAVLSWPIWNGAELDCLCRGKEARCDLLFDPGEELFNFVLSVDNLNGNGEIFSQPFDLEGVDHTGVRPESHKPSVDGGAG